MRANAIAEAASPVSLPCHGAARQACQRGRGRVPAVRGRDPWGVTATAAAGMAVLHQALQHRCRPARPLAKFYQAGSLSLAEIHQVILAGKFGLGKFHRGAAAGAAVKFIHPDGLA